MTAPALSVLIPTHDRPDFLREAIRSVLADGFSDLEIVISDDSATGSAAPVVEAFADPRLRLVRNPVAGMITNWDFAARQARGRFLTKLDDDNSIRPGFLTRSVALLENEADVASVYTGHCVRRDGGEIEEIIDTTFFALGTSIDGFAYARAVLTNEGGYPRNQKTSAVFRREAAERIDFYKHAREDFAFSAALGLSGRVAYIPEVLYEWRIHAGSGVKDLRRTHRASDDACAGLLDLTTLAVPESRRAEWRQWVTVTRHALPLFYLRAAFNDVGFSAGWTFWNGLRRDGSLAWHPFVLACLLAASVTTRAQRRTLFEWYQRHPDVQRCVAAVLRR